MSRTKISYRGDRVALFCMDGGGTTGLAWSTPLLEGSSEEIFERDPITIDQVDCRDNEVEGAKIIAETYREAVFHWQVELLIPLDHIFFVYEDFILYPDRQHSSDREGLSPVRVTSLVQGMLVMDQIQWVAQMASIAKTTYTNDRLRKAGLWVRGMSKTEHGVDAMRHLATWVRRNMA